MKLRRQACLSSHLRNEMVGLVIFDAAREVCCRDCYMIWRTVRRKMFWVAVYCC